MTSVTAHAVCSLLREKTCVLEHLSLAELWARVEAIIDSAQARFEHVSIDLRRRQIGVTEHHLNRAKIGAPFEQVRRERMPHHVWAQRARESGLDAVTLQNFPEADARQRPAARVDEEAR